MVPPEIDRDLDRLVELELVEIPRLRNALAAWPDDAYFASDLRRFLDEASGLAERLGVDRGALQPPVRRTAPAA
jgi:hypothetical protein